jgi:hypothetical protein
MLVVVLTACDFGRNNQELEVPTAPPDFKAEINSHDAQKVDLTWGGNTQVEYYEVSKDNGATWQNVGSTLLYTFENLVIGQEYTFKIRAVNEKGTSPESTAKATPATVPTAPTNVRFALNNDGSITFTWSPVANNGGTPVIKYQISASFEYFDNGLDNNNWRDVTSGTSYTYQNFIMGHDHYSGLNGQIKGTNEISGTNIVGQTTSFNLRAVNAAGNGETVLINALPKDSYHDGHPFHVQNVLATASSGQITLTWLQPMFDGNFPIVAYELVCIPTSQMSNYVIEAGKYEDGRTAYNIVTDLLTFTTLPSTARSHTLTGLQNGTEYTVLVLARNTFGGIYAGVSTDNGDVVKRLTPTA